MLAELGRTGWKSWKYSSAMWNYTSAEVEQGGSMWNYSSAEDEQGGTGSKCGGSSQRMKTWDLKQMIINING